MEDLPVFLRRERSSLESALEQDAGGFRSEFLFDGLLEGGQGLGPDEKVADILVIEGPFLRTKINFV
jgi:hypothetical protein